MFDGSIRRWLLVCSGSLLIFAAAGCSSGGGGGGGGNGGAKKDTGGGKDTKMADVQEDTTQKKDVAPDGTDKPDGMGGDCTSPTNVAGTATTHRIENTTVDSPSLGGGQVGLIAASGALTGNVSYLETEGGQKATQSFGSDFSGKSKDWSFQKVKTKNVSLGLIGVVDDASESSDKFVQTATGLAGASDAKCDMSDGRVFALSTTTEKKLASLVGAKSDDISGDPKSLINTGFILALYLNNDGDPMKGVTATKNGSKIENAYYPNAALDSVSTGKSASTSEKGLAIIPDASLSQSPGYSGTKDGGPNFAAQAGGSPDGIAFAMIIQPSSSSGN